jgi:hypothetical protein
MRYHDYLSHARFKPHTVMSSGLNSIQLASDGTKERATVRHVALCTRMHAGTNVYNTQSTKLYQKIIQSTVNLIMQKYIQCNINEIIPKYANPPSTKLYQNTYTPNQPNYTKTRTISNQPNYTKTRTIHNQPNYTETRTIHNQPNYATTVQSTTTKQIPKSFPSKVQVLSLVPHTDTHRTASVV